MVRNDPFDLLGVPPRMDLDPDELERRYLALSRRAHPDHRAAAADQAEVLGAAAAINAAFGVLRDPWTRARALVERLDPTALARTEKLPPEFLMEAMELAETVATTTDADARRALHERLTARLDEQRARLTAALEAGDADTAAGLLHRSRYVRKALDDLTGMEDA